MIKKLTIATLFSTLISLATPALALSEREGQDIYQRGMYLEAIEYWKKPPPPVMRVLPIG